MNDPLVSIIIATYNRASFISKAIDSVINQTYRNWELIIWIDGSSDNTEEIIKSFADDRITYYYEENHGKCFALNRAIEKSNGYWIAILDDDDVWHNSKLQIQVALLQQFPEIDLLFTDFFNINLSTGERGEGFSQLKKAMNNLIVKEINESAYKIMDLWPESINISNFILPSTVMIKKKVLIEVDGFNENLRNAEDVHLWWKLFLKGSNFYYINKILVNRLKPEGSLSSTNILTYENVLKSIDYCSEELLKNNREDLLYLLQNSYRRVWLSLTKLYLKSGEIKLAHYSYKNSRNYGITIYDHLKLLFFLIQTQLRVIKNRFTQSIN
jgi:glycosyltransferase involved in cell wall biosynthesis